MSCLSVGSETFACFRTNNAKLITLSIISITFRRLMNKHRVADVVVAEKGVPGGVTKAVTLCPTLEGQAGLVV